MRKQSSALSSALEQLAVVGGVGAASHLGLNALYGGSSRRLAGHSLGWLITRLRDAWRALMAKKMGCPISRRQPRRVGHTL